MKTVANTAKNLNTVNHKSLKIFTRTWTKRLPNPWNSHLLHDKLTDTYRAKAELVGIMCMDVGHTLDHSNKYFAEMWHCTPDHAGRVWKKIFDAGLATAKYSKHHENGRVKTRRIITIIPFIPHSQKTREATKHSDTTLLSDNVFKSPLNYPNSLTRPFMTEGQSITKSESKGHEKAKFTKEVVFKSFKMWVAILLTIGFERKYIGFFKNNLYPRLEVHQFNRVLAAFEREKSKIGKPGAWIMDQMKEVTGYVCIYRPPPNAKPSVTHSKSGLVKRE